MQRFAKVGKNKSLNIKYLSTLAVFAEPGCDALQVNGTEPRPLLDLDQITD